MFKIRNVSLNDIDVYSFFDDYTLVFGDNNTGKSILFNIIYYMMGSNKGWNDKDVWSLQGMDNVNFVTIELFNGKSIFFKRNRSGQFFYKNDKNDNYLLIDVDVYQEKIQSMLIANDDCFELYHNAVGEKLSYRSWAYCSFIDQYALGNVIHVFPQSTDYKFAKRIRRQMQFLFDSKKQKELIELEKQRDDILKIIEDNKNIIVERKILIEQINSLMNYLEIENPDSYEDKKKNFNLFCSDRNNKRVDPVNKELTYLLNVSNTLNNQIQIEKAFRNQRDLIGSRNKKYKLLLQLLQNSIGEYEEYNDYHESIKNTLSFLQTENDVLSMKDYSASIESIIKEKNKIDKLIFDLKNSLNEKSDKDVSNSINSLAFLFNKFEKINNIVDISSLEENKKKIDSKIKDLKESINAGNSKKLNSFIQKLYLGMPQELSFVFEDIGRPDFSMEFVPSKIETIGKQIEIIKQDGKEYKKIVEFVPGSKARQTCWQIITYIGLHVFAKEIYPSLPLLPILVVDAINEPFDDKFEIAFNYLSKICSEYDVQLICTSTKRINSTNLIDISEGLNSKHVNS